VSKPIGIANDRLVAQVERSPNARVQVRRCRHKSGTEYVDVRVWTRTWGAEEYKPGKGVTLRLDELAAVAEALEKAAEK
jgi:hypothetical protein